MESPSTPSDDPGFRQHPRVRRGRSPRDAIPSGHFSDARAEPWREEGREGEVEDGRFSSRVARDIGGLCHGEAIDAVR